jgi:hypothetical protein
VLVILIVLFPRGAPLLVSLCLCVVFVVFCYHAGYQQYNFCVVKELAEPSMKLAEQQQQEKKEETQSDTDKDK